MKKYNITLIIQSVMLSSVIFFATSAKAQSDKEKSLIQDCDSAKAEFIQTDPSLSNLFETLLAMLFFLMSVKVLWV